MAEGKVVVRGEEIEAEQYAWGRLLWFASGKLGNSRELTVGQCILKPGCENPAHAHSNCEEVLRVASGRIVHTYGEECYEMGPGDVITVPRHVRHNARNVGEGEAVLEIAFSSADRKADAER